MSDIKWKVCPQNSSRPVLISPAHFQKFIPKFRPSCFQVTSHHRLNLKETFLKENSTKLLPDMWLRPDEPQTCFNLQNNRCEETLQQLTRAICNDEEEEGRMGRQTDEQSTVFLPGPVRIDLCCLVGSSATVKAWPGHIGAGGGQRGESKGAQHYADASPTTMSHFRPLWFGLRGWPPAS